MYERRAPAVLLGGGAPTAIPVARSLGGHGVEVQALGQASSLIRFSRFCARFVDLGSGDGVQERWLTWLGEQPPGAVVLPCSDEGLELVARRRASLEDQGHRPLEANDEVVLAMLDKARTYELAEASGVETPRTFVTQGHSDLEEALRRVPMPCAVKPLHSHHLNRLGTNVKAFVATDRAELGAALARAQQLGLESMVTEIVPGADDQLWGLVAYMDGTGRALVHMTVRKLRQHPIHFGVGSYRANDWDPAVAEVGLRLLRGIGARGLAQVELKRDARDGRLKLIECNHRFTAATSLILASGFDTPLLAYDRAAGRAGRPTTPRQGARRVWDAGADLRALRAYRRAGELSVPRWAVSLGHRWRLPVLRLDDALPSAVGAYRALSRLMRGAAVGCRRRGRDEGGSRAARGVRDHAATAEPGHVLLVCSPGGHLQQMLALEDAWRDRPHSWVTLAAADVEALLVGESVTLAHGPTNRNLANLARNLPLAWRTVRAAPHGAILSTGAALAVPFFLVGRLLGRRLIYVESVTRKEALSLSGKLVRPLADELFVQWPELARATSARYAGSVL